MASLNKVLLIGNLTRDPEVRYTPKGAAVANVDMAVNSSFTNAAGERKEETCFVRVEAWGKQAEVIGRCLRKGSPIFVEGRLRLDTWEKNNEKRTTMRVVCERFQFVGPKAEQQQDAAPARGESPQPENDDIPF